MSDATRFPERLVAGYETFCRNRLPVEQRRLQILAEHGQAPEIMVIGCCDSRVSPEVIFDADPGELFVVRNIANLVPPYSPDGATRAVSAALEFAVTALHVRHIVVLGHARCAGIHAHAAPAGSIPAGDFVGRWIALIEPAARKLGPRDVHEPVADYLGRLEKASILHTLENLMTFPWVRARVERKELALHAAYFGVATGDLQIGDPASGSFRALRPPSASA